MSFRARLFITFLLAGLVPIVALAFIVHHEMTGRLTRQYEMQVNEQIRVIEADLAAKNLALGATLAQIKTKIVNENQLRANLIDDAPQDKRYVLDYAAGQMALAGLSLLQLQDDKGRILSSGHFRNEYDRIEKELPALLATANGRGALATLIEARSPEGPFNALARSDSFYLGGQVYYLVGGLRVDAHFIDGLRRLTEVSVLPLFLDEDENRASVPLEDFIQREVSFPFIDAERRTISAAGFLVLHDLSQLKALQSSINRWFLIVGLIAGGLAIAVLTWVSARISLPLKELADKTAQLDLDKLDVHFRSHRKDEIGALSRLLGNMTERLRKSSALIKDAERRAAMGDLARQVNHDIKNGLTPLQNVFRHLSQLAESAPGEIPAVFAERKATVNASIDYLQGLAANYARLTPRTDHVTCDLNAIIQQVAKDVRSLNRAGIQTHLADSAEVKSDPVSLRRIIENLVDNAIDSLNPATGKLTLSTARIVDEDERPVIRLTVADNGAGMTPEQTSLIFQDFYTTKEKGTGLGLSIVRRLVMDLDGAIRVESEPQKGTRFTLDFPGSTHPPTVPPPKKTLNLKP